MLGFAPVVAVVAMVVAIFAIMGNQSGHAQISKDATEIGALKETLSASKLELDKLKAMIVSASRENALLNEKIKKQDELLTRVVQNVTPIQTKLKISPTLEAQLLGPASAVSAAPVAQPAHQPPAPVKPEAKPVMPKPEKSHAPAAAKVPAKPHKAAPATAPAQATANDKELSPQVKAMKEAIERFNQK
jgi:hypothetical protein